MKGKYAKTSHSSQKSDKPQIGSAVRVAGEHRRCDCGVVVKKGIMYEYNSALYCSRRCVLSVMNNQ